MSFYYESIQTIIQKNKNNEDVLAKYYTETVINRLNEVKTPVRNCFVLLSDLCYHIKDYPYENMKLTLHTLDCTDEYAYNFTFKHEDAYKSNKNDELIEKLKIKLFSLKMLNIRALILDLIDVDYTSDSQTFYKPEKWIYEVIKEMEETFNDTNYKKDFHMFFLNDCKRIFMGQNERFGWYGNLLVMNFMVYEK
ncbi:hypothetical protein BDAP_000116 [Binucleata daphniae]